MKFNSIIYILILAILILAFGIIHQIILSHTIDEDSEKFIKRQDTVIKKDRIN